MIRKFLALTVCTLLAFPFLTSTCDAGVMALAGTTKNDSTAPYNGKAWKLDLVYTPNLSGAAATITAATLTIDSVSFLLNTNGASDTVAVTSDIGLNNDKLFINADFLPYGTGPAALGTNVAVLVNMVVQGTTDISPAIASEPNISALALPGNAVTSGTFVLQPSAAAGGGTSLINFTGTVQAPEPASLALLSGLALVVSARYLKRRSAKAA